MRGGYTFAEHPHIGVPDARIIWRADYDPGTLAVAALPGNADDPDAIDPAALLPWLTMAAGADGLVHAVLSDGLHRIRLDLVTGSMVPGQPVIMHYRLHGMHAANPKILPLRRLLDLCRFGRFNAPLFPADRRLSRWSTLLRVHDAAAAGATQREIAAALFGDAVAQASWRGESDFVRSRVRRLVGEARAMARGGWQWLMRPHP